MSEDKDLFLQLIIMFQTAAYQQMGKIKNPLTDKVENDLAQAQFSIDMLGMLEEKTKGNLSEEEKKYIELALYELRMNYLDEVKKEGEGKSTETEKSS